MHKNKKSRSQSSNKKQARAGKRDDNCQFQQKETSGRGLRQVDVLRTRSHTADFPKTSLICEYCPILAVILIQRVSKPALVQAEQLIVKNNCGIFPIVKRSEEH